jgi:hypothetical protein
MAPENSERMTAHQGRVSLSYLTRGINVGGDRASECRRRFLQLEFKQQVALIGEYAKQQLAKVDKILEGVTASDKPESAVALWEQKLKMKGSESGSDKITKVCSELGPESKNITDIFDSCYVFWVRQFYSCDEQGKVYRMTTQGALPTRLQKSHMKMIDDAAGMPKLGFNIKNFALYLYCMQD